MSKIPSEHGYDVVIIGGSFAGLSAALQNARARRRVVVIDAGRRRNRFASESHGFLGQDGRDPAAIVADARAQLLAYPTVTWLDDAAVGARVLPRDGGFSFTLASGAEVIGQRVVLALGVADEGLDDVPGVAERWGKHVFHCPYCHGYELDGGPIGVLATSPLSVHSARMLPDWGPTTYFSRGLFEPDAEQLALLERRGVTIERTPVLALEGHADIRLADGRVIALAGVFAMSRVRVASPLPTQLGCAIEDGPMGERVTTDARRETTVPGVFACGDMAMPAASIAFAVGDGMLAGVAAHQSLIFR